MPYLQSITRIHEVSDGLTKDLMKILENVASLKNEAVVPTPSRQKPPKFQEALREKEKPLKEAKPTIETAQHSEGALAEIEARLKGYINHVGRSVEERLRAHFEAPLVNLNQKVNSIITLLQTHDVAMMEILHVPEENVLE